MKTPEQVRLELLAALARIGRLRPEWRPGQTMANLAMTAGRLDPGGVWDMEDEEALAAAITLFEQCSDETTVSPSAAVGPVDIATPQSARRIES